MEALILVPLRRMADRPGGPDLRGVIIIDGLDECEAEQYSDGSRAKSPPPRTNEEDQLEILQVLQTASLDPSFPFRILIASRPERVFREFFDPQSNPTLFSQKIDLHEDHNADADITLFLEARFSRIRRRYNLPPSWPPPGGLETLVKNASGQFIYAATVIRFLDTGHQEPPKALLDAILKMGSKVNSNPLKQLDDLYSHILASSPDPPLSVRWIHAIRWLSDVPLASTASNANLLLQTDPESNEADHLLGNLHSLIQIPSPSDQATTNYDFYHKSLFDFLKDPGRCGEWYIEDTNDYAFVWERFISQRDLPACSADSEVLPTPASADWWVSLAIARKEAESLWEMFKDAHDSCPWYRCKPIPA
ncbi:hypothetical protein H1R20_g7203, partial [Candolleomyces eurysporus]